MDSVNVFDLYSISKVPGSLPYMANPLSDLDFHIWISCLTSSVNNYITITIFDSYSTIWVSCFLSTVWVHCLHRAIWVFSPLKNKQPYGEYVCMYIWVHQREVKNTYSYILINWHVNPESASEQEIKFYKYSETSIYAHHLFQTKLGVYKDIWQ